MELSVLEKNAIFQIGEKLQLLDCALLSNNEEWLLQELLLKPGEYRLQLLEWFLHKFEVDSLSLSRGQTSTEQQENDFLLEFANLGLCKRTDIDIIGGKTSTQRQLKFWQKLLNLLPQELKETQRLDYKEHSAEDTGLKVPLDAAYSSCIDDEYERHCDFIQAVILSGHMKSLQNEKVFSFPPDVKRDVKKTMSRLEKNQYPSVTDLKAKVKTNEGGMISINKAKTDINTKMHVSEIRTAEACTEGYVPTLENDEQRHLNTEIKRAILENVEIGKEFMKFSEECDYVPKSQDIAGDQLGVALEELLTSQTNLAQILNDLDLAKTSSLNLAEKSESAPRALPEYNLSESCLDKYIVTLHQSLSTEEAVDILKDSMIAVDLK